MVPFQRPSITLSVASIGHSLICFFDTAIGSLPRRACTDEFVSTLFFVSITTSVDGMERVIAIVALVLTGPLVGVELGVAAFTNPLASKLPDDAYRVFRSGGSRLLGALMPFWYIGTLAVLIAGAVVSRNPLAIVSVALMAAALLLTITRLVPINNRIGAWRSNDEVNRDLASRWDRLHWVRVGLLIAMFTLLAVGVVA
jgi:Domain of unknown function (DUF1772)